MLFSFQAESNGKDTPASPVCLDELDKLIQTLTLDPEEEPVAKVNLALLLFSIIWCLLASVA